MLIHVENCIRSSAKSLTRESPGLFQDAILWAVLGLGICVFSVILVYQSFQS